MTGESESEKVRGGSGITAGGDVSIGDVSGPMVIGDHNTLIQSIGQTDLEELRKSLLDFQNGIEKLGLPPNYENIVNGDISSAIIEAEEKKPGLAVVKQKFESAINTAKKAGKTITEISELYEPAKKIASILGITLSFL